MPKSAYGLLPHELAVYSSYNGSFETLFQNIQRPWLWHNLGRRSLQACKDLCFETLEMVEQKHSKDSSTKVLFKTHDGHLIESVHMPRAVKNPRVTLCISSQIGCAIGCTFCATGKMGLIRNLKAFEIVQQVQLLLHHFGPKNGGQVNLVFMGMGEPLANIEALEQAINILCHPKGIGLYAKRITVSTSGLIPGIQALAKFKIRPLLALSVNDSSDATRRVSMPITNKYGLEDLKNTLQQWPFRHRERITLEYVLRKGENDRQEDAKRLANFAASFSSHINIIPLNTHGLTASQRPTNDHVYLFSDWLYQYGQRAYVRFSKADDIAGACGQLINLSKKKDSNKTRHTPLPHLKTHQEIFHAK